MDEGHRFCTIEGKSMTLLEFTLLFGRSPSTGVPLGRLISAPGEITGPDDSGGKGG